nr:hypothetical protein [Vibrio vulnificus]
MILEAIPFAFDKLKRVFQIGLTVIEVGFAGTIEPIANIGAEVFWRDWTSMLFVTGLLLLAAARFGKSQTISRSEGAVLLLCYLGYNGYLIYGAL